jgi:hypothetical protein
MKPSLGRRTFMRSVGALAATLPCFRLLESSAVDAQAAAPPLRFLCIVNPHGNPYEYWAPRSSATAAPGSGTETDYTFDFDHSVLAPLDKYKSRMLVLDGVSEQCTINAGHYGLMPLLTGSQLDTNLADQDKILPSNESLDQFLGDMVGGATLVRSLALGVGSQNPGYQTVLNFSPGGGRIPVTIDPRKVWTTLFSKYMATPDPSAGARLAANQSILDYAQASLTKLEPRLAATEKTKLEQHLQALRDLEKQIAAMPSRACTVPPQPTGAWTKLNYLDYEASQYYPDFIDIMNGLIAQAFACDLTRVATLRIGCSGDAFPMPYLGPEFNVDLHNEVAHKYNAMSFDVYSQRLAAIENWYAQRLVTVLDALDAIPEGDGTVLDHTIVLWTTEMGNPAGHDSRNLMMALFGAKGVFRMGRYLKYPTIRGDLSSVCAHWLDKPETCTTMTAHNHLLVSIAQAFGQNVDTFGWNAVSGPLSGLT